MTDRLSVEVAVRMRFVGAGLWDGGDIFPDDVPVPRVPVAGEALAWPDTGERWIVAWVEYDYANGLGFAPVVGVVYARPSDLQAVREAEGLAHV